MRGYNVLGKECLLGVVREGAPEESVTGTLVQRVRIYLEKNQWLSL